MLLEDLRVVLKVAQFLSITGAAESLDMRTATASAALKRVERKLGAELFIRTTRQLRLSAAGERYIPTCEQVIQLLERAQQNVKEDLDTVDGDLRVSVPSDLGRNIILPWLDEFMQRYSGVNLKLHISDSQVDFYRDSVDVAIRYGSPQDANFYGFKICQVPRVLCASPAYLSEHGEPSHPSELTQHNCLLYQLHDMVHDTWEFAHNKDKVKVKAKGNRMSNDAELVRRWCMNGKGIALKSCLDMSSGLMDEAIVNLLPNYPPSSTELWLLCPTRQTITPAVRLLREHLKDKCAELLGRLQERGFIAGYR